MLEMWCVVEQIPKGAIFLGGTIRVHGPFLSKNKADDFVVRNDVESTLTAVAMLPDPNAAKIRAMGAQTKI